MKFRTSLLIVFNLFIFTPFAFAQFPEINSIAFNATETNYDVTVKGKGNLRCTASFLENPPRIDLTFLNTINRISSILQPAPNAFIERVEVMPGQSAQDAKVRLVLKSKFAYAMDEIPSGVVVHLYGNYLQQTNASQGGQTAMPQREISDDQILIGPEDLLEINVFQLPEFSMTTRVLGDGTITMPLAGAIHLAGLSRKQAEEKISKALTAKQVNNPSVSITIKEYKSRHVSVLGSVKNAGMYYLTSNRTLLQLLSEAGGLAPDAGTICYIFRDQDKLTIDLHDLMQNGNQKLNVMIRAGDVINVPSQTRTFVYVLGAVRTPGAVEILPQVGLTLAGAIARAGGPTRLASVSNIQIKRKNAAGEEEVIKANLKDIISNKVPDIPLLPDDLINVPESFF